MPMPRNLLLCGLSGLAGAVLVSLGGHRDLPFTSVAQEWSTTPAAPAAALPPPPNAVPSARFALADGLTTEERVNIAVYEAVHRSVVNINTRAIRYDSYFFAEIPSESEGLGSGSVLDRDGHILTNYHVVEDAQQIEVTLATGKRYAARPVGYDALNDIAVLRIGAPPAELHPIVLGDSSSLKVGQRIYVIGSPFELERTFTTGIISSLNRTLPSRDRRRIMKSIIQVDAAMNPGNSGGPLLDTRGRVIGMSTAIASKTGESAGVGFAIPVDRIKRVVPELIRYGTVTRPDIGISVVELTDRGLRIRALVPGGPAEQAGLEGCRVARQRSRRGPLIIERDTIDRTTADVIVAVDGKEVRTLDDFLSCVEAKKPGEDVVLTIDRQGQRMDVAVRLQAAPP
ncbi:MAG: hypothetical protein A2W31_12525 [Planctomycetes bacterium RBG_16_64_10]|nr:MAG: hypothetical protein A2W31_12525 [Planctomycetes bacterium RBG_16_64_10]